MTNDQIKHMVDRFLSWKLPEQFTPDDGISFEPIAGKDGPHPFKREPSGTNLFDATQAEAMVRYMLEGLKASSGNCASCRFWQRDGEGIDGQCRKMCPMGSTVREDRILPGHPWVSIWPLTSATDWCGDHQSSVL